MKSEIFWIKVLRALQSIDPCRATRFDLIPPRVHKLLSEEIATPSTAICNQVLKKSEWPKEWKKGEWVPVYKKEDQHNVANYRPVTILTAVDKIFEQLLCHQLVDKFEAILDAFMSACRKKYSCETTLLRLVEDWKHGMDMGQTVGIFSSGTSEVFDSLHPSLLSAKLRAYGFSQSAVILMRSYFTDRENRTRVGQVVSSWKEINRGCPQGSALGPMLWNIYQNDVFYIQLESQLSAYADDHQLYYAHQDPEQAVMGSITMVNKPQAGTVRIFFREI